LPIRDLFPDVPHEIFLEGGDLSVIRKATEEALKKVNMNMIKPNDTVNLLSSQYGFQIMGGQAYAEMLKTIKDVVEAKTGCHNIRLRVATGFRIREPLEIAEEYKLNEFFNGQVKPVRAIDPGVPIETEIGIFMAWLEYMMRTGSSMPIMGKYYMYYGGEFMPPRKLGRINAQRFRDELILDNIYGEVSEKIRDVLLRLNRSGRHLLTLINDVLDLSKIEAGQLTLSLVDYSMREVVHTVLTGLESLAAEKGLALKTDISPDLPLGRGDDRRIRLWDARTGRMLGFCRGHDDGVNVLVIQQLPVIGVRFTAPPAIPAAASRRTL
jgi:hypothetical protein